jgi:hypothetical protein
MDGDRQKSPAGWAPPFPDGGSIFCRRIQPPVRSRLDPVTKAEIETMNMLYRETVEFAVGLGVAVHAETDPADPTIAKSIETRVVPVQKVQQQTPPTEKDFPAVSRVQAGKELRGTPHRGFPRL